MAIIQVKKYKTIKDENGNKKQVPKIQEEWNKETRNGTMTWYFYDRYKLNTKTRQYVSRVFALKREVQDKERLFLNNPVEYSPRKGEQPALKIKDIDSEHDTIYFHNTFSRNKNGAEEIGPIKNFGKLEPLI